MQRTVRNGHLFMLLLRAATYTWSDTSSVGKELFLENILNKQII